jgi:uncharacterized protein YndB with AHSA1/START domain
MATNNEKPRAVHVTFIRASAEQVWNALTSEQLSSQYFFGRRLESDWKKGSRWTAYLPDNAGVDTTGEVIESDPPRRLVVTWHVQWLEEARKLGPALVSYEIEPAGEGVVKLRIIEEMSPETPQKFRDGGREGWGAILASLKSMLETGQALDIRMEPPK